ncbi:hypothetical protein DPMN_102278 [Dreissena polymorpha]|uniref:Uncharacterized protein n=1 Tax=Dreissena polymorpha TaxID=45954 RepID=A0A9D4LJ06_DREPO|nr:hypothetical protein DPMN_102278 [Dreissena polymorpha]
MINDKSNVRTLNDTKNTIGGFGDSDNDVTFAHAQILAVKTAAILLLFACDEPHRDKVTIIFATLLKNKKYSELEIRSD